MKSRVIIAVGVCLAAACLLAVSWHKFTAENEHPSVGVPLPVQLSSVPREQWQATTQPIEMGAWAMRGQQECEDIPKLSEWTMRRFGFAKDQFAGKVLLDVGPGPVGRLTWLDGTFIAIEPLGEQLKVLPFARMEKYGKIYAQPAEDRIDELVGKVDEVIAINSLDHAFNLDAILQNLFLYLKPGGEAFISVDVDIDRKEPDLFHPLRLTHGGMRESFSRHGFEILREEQGNCVYGEDDWGSGGVAYHWWLKKP